MTRSIAGGVWPTMVTPFTNDDHLDLNALEAMVEWYLARGVDGLFAVCQSSEMFFLTLPERVALAKAVVDFVGGRAEVVASGHISDSLDAQVAEVQRIADTGVDAVVLVTNRFALEGEDDDAWIATLERFLARITENTERASWISDEAMAALCRYPWPGNVRELESTLERALNQSHDGTIRVEDLPATVRVGRVVTGASPHPEPVLSLEESEREAILRAGWACQGRVTEMAEQLRIGRTTL